MSTEFSSLISLFLTITDISIYMNKFNDLYNSIIIDEKINFKPYLTAGLLGAASMGTGGFDAYADNYGKQPSIERIAQNKPTNLSEIGKNFIKDKEGLKLKPYDDHTGKPVYKWIDGATIGYGHYILKSEWEKYKNGISKQEAINLFNNDISRFERVVRDNVKTNLKQNQFDALVSLAFNIGVKNFNESSLLKLLNKESGSEYDTIEKAWKAWRMSKGKVMKGLVIRRAEEYNMFNR